MIELLNGRHLALIEPDWIDDEIVNGESVADRWSFQRWSDRRLAKANRPVIGPKFVRTIHGVWVRQ